MAGTTSYVDSTRTVTFTPSAALPVATLTVNVTGARDAAGNVMDPVTWTSRPRPAAAAARARSGRPQPPPPPPSTADSSAVELGVKFRPTGRLRHRHPVLQGSRQHRHPHRVAVEQRGHPAGHRDLQRGERDRVAAGHLRRPGPGRRQHLVRGLLLRTRSGGTPTTTATSRPRRPPAARSPRCGTAPTAATGSTGTGPRVCRTAPTSRRTTGSTWSSTPPRWTPPPRPWSRKSPAAGSDSAPANTAGDRHLLGERRRPAPSASSSPARREPSRPGRVRRRHPDRDLDPVGRAGVLDDLHGDRQRRARRRRERDGPAHLELRHRGAPAPRTRAGPGRSDRCGDQRRRTRTRPIWPRCCAPKA